jgi:hypothetical protein
MLRGVNYFCRPCCLSSRCYPSAPLVSYPAAPPAVVAVTWIAAPALPAITVPGHAAPPGSRVAVGGAERSELALDAGGAAWHGMASIRGQSASSALQRAQPWFLMLVETLRGVERWCKQ